jgi:hypothetical protein
MTTLSLTQVKRRRIQMRRASCERCTTWRLRCGNTGNRSWNPFWLAVTPGSIRPTLCFALCSKCKSTFSGMSTRTFYRLNVISRKCSRRRWKDANRYAARTGPGSESTHAMGSTPHTLRTTLECRRARKRVRPIARALSRPSKREGRLTSTLQSARLLNRRFRRCVPTGS